jgi:predicted RNA-binding Zn-ribbon protein involved in translation (DUF1610 family)
LEKGEITMPDYLCQNCGKKVSWYDSKKKDAETGKYLCPKCGSILRSKDGKEEALQEALDSTFVCQFQEPILDKQELRGYYCTLTTFGTTSTLGSRSRRCDPEWCPIYQTWQLLKDK